MTSSTICSNRRESTGGVFRRAVRSVSGSTVAHKSAGSSHCEGRFRPSQVLASCAVVLLTGHAMAHGVDTAASTPHASHAPVAHENDTTLSWQEAVDQAQSRHDFERALTLVDERLADHPHDDTAWLQRMALSLITGDVPSARNACAALRTTSPLIVATCHARIAHATDQPDRIGLRLSALLDVLDTTAMDPTTVAWAHSVAGDLAAARGDSPRAVSHYEASLSLDNNPQVRAAWADILIDAQRWEDAQRVLATGDASLTLVVQRLIVAKRLGRDVSGPAGRIAHRFDHWEAEGDYEHAREMARFFLDVVGDRERAARLAAINASLQHEPEDRQLLARASAPSDL